MVVCGSAQDITEQDIEFGGEVVDIHTKVPEAWLYKYSSSPCSLDNTLISGEVKNLFSSFSRACLLIFPAISSPKLRSSGLLLTKTGLNTDMGSLTPLLPMVFSMFVLITFVLFTGILSESFFFLKHATLVLITLLFSTSKKSDSLQLKILFLIKTIL